MEGYVVDKAVLQSFRCWGTTWPALLYRNTSYCLRTYVHMGCYSLSTLCISSDLYGSEVTWHHVICANVQSHEVKWPYVLSNHMTCPSTIPWPSSLLQKSTSGTQTPAVTTTRHDTYTTIDIHKPGTLFVSGLIKVRGGQWQPRLLCNSHCKLYLSHQMKCTVGSWLSLHVGAVGTCCLAHTCTWVCPMSPMVPCKSDERVRILDVAYISALS